jgi:hypothetical protein
VRRTFTICRLVATGAVLVGLLPSSGARAQEPGVDASISQLAYATNIVRHGGHDYMYIVGAEHVTRPNGRTRTTAYAKRSRCVTLEKKHIKLIACAAFVFPKRIPENAFEFDPLLQSARVRIKGKDGRTDVKWSGRSTPEPNASPFADASYGAGAYAEVYRVARASGTILGERYPRGPMGFALLIEGAMAEAYTAGDTTITRMDNGALKIETRRRIPR